MIAYWYLHYIRKRSLALFIPVIAHQESICAILNFILVLLLFLIYQLFSASYQEEVLFIFFHGNFAQLPISDLSILNMESELFLYPRLHFFYTWFWIFWNRLCKFYRIHYSIWAERHNLRDIFDFYVVNMTFQLVFFQFLLVICFLDEAQSHIF